MSTVNPISTEPPSYPTVDRKPAQSLGQDDFLKLLITQLTTQDPMAPKKDTDFFMEMATFSSLEQNKEIQAEISLLRADQQVLQANSLLGRTVEVQVDESTRISGLVSAVRIEAGTPLVVLGDHVFALSDVTGISPTLIP